VTSIGEAAFDECPNLQKIYYAGSESDWNNIEIGSDNECLKNVTIYYNVIAAGETKSGNLKWKLRTDGTLVISGSGAMEDYGKEKAPWYDYRSDIKNITLSEGVTSIGEYAFDECESLTGITIPEGLTIIGGHAFCECESLTSITLPKGLTSIGYGAFAYSGLTSITLPEGLTSIGETVFYKCLNLESVTIPNSVTSIGMGAFYHCESLTSITLPDGVTSISEWLFDGCYNLTSITLPDSVTSIRYAALASTSIESIKLPRSLESIGDYVFEECYNLTSVTLPEGLTSIGEGAFSKCESLTSITLPKSLTSIGEAAFDACTSLQKVYYAGSESDWAQIVIGDNNECLTNATIYYNHPQHSYTDQVTTEPTYEAEGVRTYTCTICGESYTEAIEQLPPVSLFKTKIALSKLSVVYTGKAQKPSVTIKIGKVTVPESQYIVSYSNNTNVGIAKVTIKAAKGATYVSGSVTILFIITKAANPLTVSPSEKTLKASDCKKKAQTLTIDVKNAQGTVSYRSSSRYVTVSKGKVTVKKGTPKGTYRITVTAMGNKNYKAGSKTATITVK
jgi:hypothetical protein